MNFKSTQKRLTIALLRRLYRRQPVNLVIPENPQSIALFAQERFGDVIMMSPLIRSLHRAYPDCEIYIISVNKIADYLTYDPLIKRVLRAKHPETEVKRFLNEYKFDLLFNTKDHPSVTFLFLAGKLHAGQKIGIRHPQHEDFFDVLLSAPADASTVQTYLSLLRYLRIPYSEKDYIPYLPDGQVSGPIKEFCRKIPQETVTVNLSASQTYKEWPLHKWIALLKKLTSPVIVLAMPKQHTEKKELESKFPNIIPSPPTLTIFDAGYLISRSQLLITPDTALVHVASCTNTPVIALYRQALDLRKFPPFSSIQQSLMSMDGEIASITVNEVLKALNELKMKTSK